MGLRMQGWWRAAAHDSIRRRRRSLASAAWAALAFAPFAGAQVDVPDTEAVQAAPRVTGRFVGNGGQPLAGVAFDGRWRGLGESASAPWVRLAALKTDAAGGFVIELESGANLELLAKPPGHAGKNWSRQILVGGKGHDFGDVVFEPEAALTVWITDAHGALLTHGWSVEALVYAAHEDGELHPPGPTYGSVAPIDTARGSARFSNLPRGRVQLVARGPEGVESTSTNVDTLPGRSEVVPLRYEGPDLASLVVLDVRAPARIDGSELNFVAEDGTRSALTVATRGHTRQPMGGNSVRVRGVLEGAGPWRLESIDPRFKVAAQPVLTPGARRTVELVGSATLALEVLDADTGRPIDTPTIALFELDLGGRQEAMVGSSAQALIAGAVADVVPGDYRISVGAATFAESETFLRIAPRAAHVARIELRRPVVFAGRLLDSEDTPVGDASVAVERGRFTYWEPRDGVFATSAGELGFWLVRPPFARTTTRADGRFEFTGLAPGPLSFYVERRGTCPDVLHTTHEDASEQVLRLPAPTRIEVHIDFPVDAQPPPLGIVLDAPSHPEAFAELDPERLAVVPASSAGPGSMRAVLFTKQRYCSVTLVFAEGTGEGRRWTPIGREVVDAEIGTQTRVRFDGHALLPATIRLSANATASPAVTSLRGAWLALGLQRTGDSGEAWRRSGPAPLPPPPASLETQALTVSVKVPAGDYVHFVGGPGWRWIALETLSCTLLQTIDVAVDVDPPLVAREVRLAAENGTPLASTGAQLWFEGVHPLPRGERLIPVAVLTDEAGRFRAVGPVGATLHAHVVRDAQGATVRARPAPTLDFEPTSDGSAVMALGADRLVLTVRAP